MSPLSLRRLACASACASLAFPIAAAHAAAPAPARPGTYEQISRASGAAGATKLEAASTPAPLWVSDLGITAAYNGTGQSITSPTVALPTTVLRNTLANETRAFGPDRGALVSADRTEQIGLFRRLVRVGDYQVSRSWAVGRIDGRGALRQLDVSEFATVVMSGNGRFVFSSDQQGLRRLDLASGQWTTIEPFALIGRMAVSDDGQVVAGLAVDVQAQRLDAAVWRGTTKTTLISGYPYRGEGSEPALSADGSTVFTFGLAGEDGNGIEITARRLRSGRRFTTLVPFQKSYDARPIWLDPQGDRIAYALGYQDPDAGPVESAQVWTVGGGWATFGGAFASSLTHTGSSVLPGAAISRNGRFAALAYNDQVALVSLTGVPLIGNPLGREALSATSYFDTIGIDSCGFGFSSIFSGSFTRPAAWAPVPRSAHIEIGDGTQVLEQADWTKPLPRPGAANVPDADFISVTFPLGTEHTRTLSLRVVDGDGGIVSERQSVTLTCGAS